MIYTTLHRLKIERSVLLSTLLTGMLLSLVVEALGANGGSGTFALTGSLNTECYNHTATLLQNGEVLVTGAVDVTGNPTASSELYNPTMGKWIVTGSMSDARTATVFRMTSTGTLITLHDFDYTDGANPSGSMLANDGNFYGTTDSGGSCTTFAYGCGTIFKMTSRGTLTTLHNFDRTDGARPTGLVQHTNGTFYGTTLDGGRIVYHYCGGTCGTIYSLSVGLPAFRRSTMTPKHHRW